MVYGGLKSKGHPRMTNIPEWKVCVSIPKKPFQVRYTDSIVEAQLAQIASWHAFKAKLLEENYTILGCTTNPGCKLIKGQITYTRADTCTCVATFWIEAVPFTQKVYLGEEKLILDP